MFTIIIINKLYIYFYKQIPLGIFLHNENKLDEMVLIMDALHKYVPVVHTDDIQHHPISGEEIKVDACRFHHILIGGDQLTAARVRGAQRIRLNSDNDLGRLKGLVPVCEDWHAKQCLMGVREYFVREYFDCSILLL